MAGIVELATATSGDLSVLGAHGHRESSRSLILGSVAENIVRYAAGPVLVISAENEARSASATVSRFGSPRSITSLCRDTSPLRNGLEAQMQQRESCAPVHVSET